MNLYVRYAMNALKSAMRSPPRLTGSDIVESDDIGIFGNTGGIRHLRGDARGD